MCTRLHVHMPVIMLPVVYYGLLAAAAAAKLHICCAKPIMLEYIFAFKHTFALQHVNPLQKCLYFDVLNSFFFNRV